MLFANRPVCVVENGNPDEGQCVLCNPQTNAGCTGNTPTCERDANGEVPAGRREYNADEDAIVAERLRALGYLE